MAKQALPLALYSCEQTRKLDQAAIERAGIPGIQLMKRAGRAAFESALTHWPDMRHLVVFCGGGNNGGDGYVVAALAAQKKISVTAVYTSVPDKLSGDARRAYDYARQEGVEPVAFNTFSWPVERDGVVVADAMLGTGISREVEGEYRQAIESINAAGLPVLAIDIPSGLCGDTGRIWGDAVKAQVTATFIGLKRGLLTGRGPAFTGELLFDDLGVPQEVYDAVPVNVSRCVTERLAALLPDREADAHKGKFGHVLVVGGDTGMGGAPAMAGEVAARTGAGLVSIATQPVHVAAILARCPELMVVGVPSGQALTPYLEKPTVIVMGPGLGRDSWSEQMLQQSTLTEKTLVMDADALNLLAEGRVVRNSHRDNWVLTPHPGEAGRLLGISGAQVQADRFAAVTEIQKKYGGVVVLKGAGTLIADGNQVALANVGNPGMATGGMGDVLSGVIGGLIAQGLSLFDAACLGVCVHGGSADKVVARYGVRGVMATDLIPGIRELLN